MTDAEPLFVGPVVNCMGLLNNSLNNQCTVGNIVVLLQNNSDRIQYNLKNKSLGSTNIP